MNAGILLVATGSKYVEEALPLLGSIRLHMPDIPVHVVTDMETEIPDGLFDHIDRADIDFPDIPANKRGFMFRDYALTRTKFDRTVHIDTDTYIGASIYELFHGLERFDLLVGAAPARVDSYGNASTPLVEQNPGTFMVVPRINCGFMAYTKTLVKNGFFDKWVEMYKEGIERAERRGRTKYSDQSEFRKLLWTTDTNFQIMPPEYNFRTGAPQYLDGHVKIAHGRPPMGREKLMAYVNSFVGRRLYVPYREMIFHAENKNWVVKAKLETLTYTDWLEQQDVDSNMDKVANA